MIFITTYKTKPHMKKGETKELMEVFAKVGTSPGITAHYVAADGSGGVLVGQSDDPAEMYHNILNYREWIEFDMKAMLTIEEAVPHIMASLD